jgi:DNA primase
VGVEAYEVNRSLEAAVGGTARRRPTGPATQAPVKLTGHHRVEREVLRAIFAFPVLLDDPQLAPVEDDFTFPVHRSLFRLASAEHRDTGAVDAGRLASRVEDAELRGLASELSVGQAPEDRVARDTLSRLKVFTLERYIVERKERLRGLDPNREAAAYDALFEELLSLEKEKRAISAASAG